MQEVRSRYHSLHTFGIISQLKCLCHLATSVSVQEYHRLTVTKSMNPLIQQRIQLPTSIVIVACLEDKTILHDMAMNL